MTADEARALAVSVRPLLSEESLAWLENVHDIIRQSAIKGNFAVSVGIPTGKMPHWMFMAKRQLDIEGYHVKRYGDNLSIIWYLYLESANSAS